MIFLPLRPGVYRRGDGAIFRARLNKTKTRVYAERWKATAGGRFRFVYERDAAGTLTPTMRLPLEEAREISRAAGQCLACARILTDAASQAAGVGPTCAERWTYAEAVRGIVFEATAEQIDEAERREDEARERRALASVRARIDCDRIIIRSEYHSRIVGIIRTFDDATWTGDVWTLPLVDAGELAQAFAFAGIAHDEIAIIPMGWAA